MEPYGYCKVFVLGPPDLASLTSSVEHALHGEADHHRVMVGESAVDIRINEDRDDSKPGDFVHWPFYLDAGPDDMHTDHRLVAIVAALLEQLWGCGWQAVAACDFEEELPRRGGYLGIQAAPVS